MENDKNGGQGGKDAPAEAGNVFGEPVAAPEAKEEGDKGGDKAPSERETPTQRIERLAREHGELTAYKSDSERRHAEKDTNLQRANDTIAQLRKDLEAARGGKGGEQKPGEGEGKPAEGALFKDIKTSKDLTEDERDEMTDTEIKQMDMIASLQQGMNQLAAAIGQAGGKKDAGEGAGEAVDLNKTVRETASELAGGDTEAANLIIEAWKELGFATEGKTAEQIKAQVVAATKNVPTYTPPKEQGKAHGKPAGGGTEKDPYGVDKIVEAAAKGKDSGSFEL